MKKIFLAALVLSCAVAVVSCSSKSGNITVGDKSHIDSLSYCIGENIGFSVSSDMADIPFNIDLVKKGIEEGALDKASQNQEESIDILRDYFMNKRNERLAKLDEQRQAAAEDSTVVVDKSVMFENAEECDNLSYAFGNDIGCNVRNSKLPLQTYWLTKGFNDAYEGAGEVAEQDVQSFLQNYFMVVRPAQLQKESNDWLAKIEKKWGVKKTASGLLYKVVKAGDKTIAAKDDRDVVVVKYEGKTKEGEVFDSSYKRVEEVVERIAETKKNKELDEQEKNERLAQFEEELKSVETVEFPLNCVIKGWTEGMKLVGKGGKIVLYIPSELAYGPRGAGRAIGPNEALEFTVELIDVKPYEAPQPAEEPATEEAAAPAEENK
ncbi:MAG: FKBP-type peptidyl-prolyl cis-trans isomerase N-terminal domain-containing protein [Alistipes sp.]